MKRLGTSVLFVAAFVVALSALHVSFVFGVPIASGAAGPPSMSDLCTQCRERPSTGTLRSYAALPWLAIDGIGFRDRLCRECAGGKEFVSLLCYAAVIAAVFVVAVVIL